MLPSFKPLNPSHLPLTLWLALTLSLSGLFGCADTTQTPGDTRSNATTYYNKNTTATSSPTPHNRYSSSRNSGKNSTAERNEMVLAQSLLLPNLALVTERIDAYERKTQQLQQISSDFAAYGFNRNQTEKLIHCRQQISSILNEYQLIKRRLVSKNVEEVDGNTFGELFVNAERSDINYLETDCNSLLKRLRSPKTNRASNDLADQLEEAEKIMIQAASENDYDTVIRTFRSLPPMEAGNQRVIFNRLRGRYGEGLIKNGRFNEAITVYSDLLGSMHQDKRLQKQFVMTKRLGDLYLSMEKHDKAKATYNQLGTFYADLMKENEGARLQLGALDVSDHTGELRDYAALLRRSMAYIPQRDGFTLVTMAKKFIEKYPFSPVNSIVKAIHSSAGKEAEQWLSSLLSRADALRDLGEYQEALLLLANIPTKILSAEKQELIATKSQQITDAQNIASEEKLLAQEVQLQEDWNKATLFLENKRYDEAITIFSAMQGTPYGKKAAKYREEAVQLAVQDDRRRAAELFIRSTKASDQQGKTKLLLASHSILRTILLKYPQTNLADKVNKNIARIENEIRAIDPSLLTPAD